MQITRDFEFDAAHRVLRHESKCKNLHGHRYRAQVTLTSPELDSLDRVIDYGCVKDVVGKWIDENWDHNTLLNREDELVAERNYHEVIKLIGREPYLFYGNPTAEKIAEELFKKAAELFEDYEHITVVSVKIFETPNCSALYP